jgi:hypothetical protein
MTGSKPLLHSLRAIMFALLTALLFGPNARAFSDPFVAPNPGSGSVLIEGNWQFHVGDDPAWSQPAFDDSAWEHIGTSSSWRAQTQRGYSGFAWYRKQISLSGRPSPIALLIPPFQDAYEVFWNGKKIGESGKLPPHARWWYHPHGMVFSIGPAPLEGVLALRVWKAAPYFPDPAEGGGLLRTPVLGSPAALAQRLSLVRAAREQHFVPRFIFSGALFITGLIAILLFVRQRSELLYLWLGLFLIGNSLYAFQGLDGEYYGFTFFQGLLNGEVVGSLQDISLWMVLLTLFALHKEQRWKRWTTFLAALYLSCTAIDLVILKFWEDAGRGMRLADAVTGTLVSVLPVYLLFIVAYALIQGRSRGLFPLALASAIYGTYNLLVGISPWAGHLAHLGWFNHIDPTISLGPYFIGIPAILNTLFFGVLLFTVARHQGRERRRQIHIEGEIRSAHEIQHVLIPEEGPTIPGFSIASVYKPAAEVGGDFYQVIPMLDSQGEPGALIVLGDVSGKGLKAAMTVSLIVGTVRTLADFTGDPVDVLRGLNQRLLGRTQGGFATCVAMRIDATGKAVIANAGHLSPFVGGREIELPGSLPLGISADADYEMVTLDLEPDDCLTLFTDGVLEARNPKGELYGFARLQSLMGEQPSVQQVVDSACSFGQDDDITVLSVKRVADSEMHHAKLDLVAQIAAG